MKLSFAKIVLIFRILAGIFVVSGTLPAIAQQRSLTAADFPKTIPKIDNSFKGLKAKAATEKLLLAPYDGTGLRLALSYTNPDFLNGTTADEIISELTTLQSQSMEELLPDIINPLNERTTIGMRTPTSGTMLQKVSTFAPSQFVTAYAFFAAVNTARRHLPNSGIFNRNSIFSDENFSMGVVNEYEYVINGMTANVREEITYSIEKRHVKFRQLKRETLEKNGDPSAVGKYVVERGTTGPEPHKSDVKMMNPRRLQSTSTHRLTTETIREATVDRCPDANGITRGVTFTAITIRLTAAATGTGSPGLIESIARGNARGQVNDAATLTGFDWEVTSQSRLEALHKGQNFSLSQKMNLRSMEGSTEPSITMSEITVSGVGSNDEAVSLKSMQDGLLIDAYVPLLDSYDKAENEWRSGRCVELVVASGAQPGKLAPGEARKLVIDARHSYEPPPIAVPITGTPGGGSIIPANAVKTPSATFTYKAETKSEGGGVIFKSISRRGIAKNIQVDFHMGKAPIKVELTYFENESQTVKRATLPGIYVEGGDETQSTNAAHTSILYHFPSTSNLNKGYIILAHDEDPEPGSKTEYIKDEGYYDYNKTETDAIIKAKVGDQTVVQGTEKGTNVSFQAYSNPKHRSSVVFTKGSANEPPMFIWNVVYPAKSNGEDFTTGLGMSIYKGEDGVEWIEKKITDPNSPYKTEYLIKVKLDAAEELKKGNKAMKDLFGFNTDELTTAIDPTKPKKDMVTATGSKTITVRILSPY